MFQKLSKLFFSSVTYEIYCLFDKKVLSHPIYRFLTDFSYVSSLWQDSMLYSFFSKKINPIAMKIYPYTRNHFLSFLKYLPLFFIIIIPQTFMSNTSYALISLLCLITSICISPSAKDCSKSVLFALFWLSFLAILFFILPTYAFSVSLRLILAANLYFLIISSINTYGELIALIKQIFIVTSLICAMHIVSLCLGTQATRFSQKSLAEIIIMFMPISLCAAYQNKNKFQRLFHSLFIITVSCSVIISLNIEAAYIGFGIAFMCFIGFQNIKLLLLLIFFLPTLFFPTIKRFFSTFTASSKDISIIDGAIDTAANFWLNGFNLKSDIFLRLYRLISNAEYNHYNNNLKPYIPFILRFGFATLLITLWYSLRLIRSSIISIFTAPAHLKSSFAAQVSSLIGISLYSLINGFSLLPESIIGYCVIIGILSIQTELKNKNPDDS